LDLWTAFLWAVGIAALIQVWPVIRGVNRA
jgi:hypothetical protein